MNYRPAEAMAFATRTRRKAGWAPTAPSANIYCTAEYSSRLHWNMDLGWFMLMFLLSFVLGLEAGHVSSFWSLLYIQPSN